MVYSVAADVRRIINTSLPDADLTSEIVLADAEIDARNLSDLGANLLLNISRFIVASYVANRDPASGPVGEGSQAYRSPVEWRLLAERLINAVSGLPFVTYNEPVNTS